jgi:hypothetical protein
LLRCCSPASEPTARGGDDLAAVGILRDFGLQHRRDDDNACRLVGPVPHLMAGRGPARERNHVARVQLALAVGRAQGDLARDDDQELLVRPVPVERELA